MPDLNVDDDDTDDQPDGPSNDQAKIGRLCELLHSATSTPNDCYFAIWNGWPDTSDLMRQSVRMHIPNRTYYLLHGPLADFGQWDVRETGYNPAAFVWPADQSWCVASDVDQHWAGIGASADTINRLLAQQDLDIVAVDPDAGFPVHRVVSR